MTGVLSTTHRFDEKERWLSRGREFFGLGYSGSGMSDLLNGVVPGKEGEITRRDGP